MCIVTCTESIACTIFIDELLNNNNTSSVALVGGLTAAVVLVLLFLVGVSVFVIAGVKVRSIKQARERISNRYVCTYIISPLFVLRLYINCCVHTCCSVYRCH